MAAQELHSAQPTLNVQGAFIRRTNLRGASLRGADMTEADATGADLRDADFQDARLRGTILRGADLTGAVNLTEAQVAEAVIDDGTRLPSYLDRRRIVAEAGTSDGPLHPDHGPRG